MLYINAISATFIVRCLWEMVKK